MTGRRARKNRREWLEFDLQPAWVHPAVLQVLSGLPEGVGLKGGPARDAVRSLAVRGFTPTPPSPRDLDFVFVGSPPPRAQLPSDTELIPSLRKYFRTRDLVVNEALLLPGKLLASRRALQAAAAEEVRPSAFEYNQYYKDVGYRTGVRGLLMAVRMGYQPSRLIETAARQSCGFDLAIVLMKAVEVGVLDQFFHALVRLGNPCAVEFDEPEPFLRHMWKMHAIHPRNDFQRRMLEPQSYEWEDWHGRA